MKRRNQSGDTLIEVAIAMAMLGLVVLTVFMVANRSLASIMDTTERTAVRASINSQLDLIEYLRDRKPDTKEWKRIMDMARLADPKKDPKLVDDIYSRKSDCRMHISTSSAMYHSFWLTYNPAPGKADKKDDRFVRVWTPNVRDDKVSKIWDKNHGGDETKNYLVTHQDPKGYIRLDDRKNQISTTPFPGYGIWVDVVKSEATDTEHEGYYIEVIARACWTPLGSRNPGEGRVKVIKRFSVMGKEVR